MFAVTGTRKEQQSTFLLLIHLRATQSFDLCVASEHLVGGGDGGKYKAQRGKAVWGDGN